jgi:hypothetical protein
MAVAAYSAEVNNPNKELLVFFEAIHKHPRNKAVFRPTSWSLSARSITESTPPQKTGQTGLWVRETASWIYSD